MLADGPITVTATFTDVNGTQESASGPITKDAAPPTVTATLAAPPATNSGWYDVGTTVAFSFAGSDATSATLDGTISLANGGRIDLDTLTARTHTIVVPGVDAARQLAASTIAVPVRATIH